MGVRGMLLDKSASIINIEQLNKAFSQGERFIMLGNSEFHWIEVSCLFDQLGGSKRYGNNTHVNLKIISFRDNDSMYHFCDNQHMWLQCAARYNPIWRDLRHDEPITVGGYIYVYDLGKRRPKASLAYPQVVHRNGRNIAYSNFGPCLPLDMRQIIQYELYWYGKEADFYRYGVRQN